MNEDKLEDMQEPVQEENTAEPQDKVQKEVSEIDKFRQEAADSKDKYLRLLAESENMRKRLNKEKQDITSYALQQLIAEFLEPIDHMEKALNYTDQMSEEVKHWSLGFKMILTQFKDVLTNNGVQPFISVGTVFNPHLHEAVETEERSDMESGRVIEEFIRGYKMGEKIIRPARVKVSKAAKPEKNE